ncbi:MAG: type III-A CRISPR-associated RAMP protein Csm3 [Caldilineaceae bacterium]|nr:type III-A CRISPR-associated RAMP protein Csm3 [Caldilineaceae bacterium]
MAQLQLTDYYLLRATIYCKSGLHIGAGNEAIEIGGLDRPVIVHPIKRHPYIPGSSLKGKLRSLLEMRHAAFTADGQPSKTQQGNTGFVGRIFGISAGDENEGQTPTALILRDAEPTPAYLNNLTLRRERGQVVLEQKSENTINRIDASANPRTIERVPEGATFAFEATYRIFALDGDDQRSRADFDHVLEALALLELDTLGGHGSRGYGQVKFEGLTCNDLAGNAVTLKPLADYLANETNGSEGDVVQNEGVPPES